MVIHVRVISKQAAVEGSPVIICGNSDYSVQFEFDEEWDNAALKTARFVYDQSGILTYEDVVFTGNIVQVPVLNLVKEVYVGVYAGDIQTTTAARILCDYSIRCGSGIPADPTPVQYDQIMALLNADAHALNKDNPHGVTRTQIGAAPAGYGLGPEVRWITENELLSNYSSTGFYSWIGRPADTAFEAPYGSGSMITVRRSDTYSHQIAFLDGNPRPAIKIRKKTEGVWGEWEYINPPMELGKEYRTTERYNGKPVYTRLISCGELANYKRIEVTSQHGATRIIRGIATISGRGPMPFDFGSGSTYNCHATFDTDIYLYSSGGHDGAQVYAQVWYYVE